SMTIATIILHQFANIGLGFKIIFMSLAGLILLTIPVIFMMPSSSKPREIITTPKIGFQEANEMNSSA
ncbi:hypothetical protein LLG34_00245, partial [bacterium]|nr:hypothetical protein [bacterium]